MSPNAGDGGGAGFQPMSRQVDCIDGADGFVKMFCHEKNYQTYILLNTYGKSGTKR